MMKNIKTFFERAMHYKIIVSNKLDKTKEMLELADNLWEKATREDFKFKSCIKDGVINPDRISEASIKEVDHLGEIQERPVVDLVQQGGGMFGIALLGYTYIMEKAGIRFHSYGGTSAGAINAAFLAAIPNEVYQKPSIFFENGKRQTTKSELLTHIIANMDFKSFMDRKGVVGYFQELLFKNIKSWKLWFPLLLLSLMFLAGLYFSLSLVFNIENGLTGMEIRFFDFIIGTLNVFAFLLFCYFIILKILGPNYGINTGNIYYRWADTLMHLLGVDTTEDLHRRLKQTKIISDKNLSNPRLVLITANLTHNKVVKLPEEASFYWANPMNLRPAAYLRATMSLPFIFHVLVPKGEHYDKIEETNRIITMAKFVDGGMLSNFPIREFHRTDGEPPSFPTFGVLLSSRESVENSRNKQTFWRYVASYLKTFRNFYDNDFLLRNEETKYLVELVNTTEFNWLDFWMEDEEKKGLFEEGAKAAIAQLKKFNWNDYKQERLNEEQKIQFK
ncbi:patatin-like phospholipase family protein [Flagellimonas onchidii]|uniref:patatin-like phospholipase family protein n=1 Tax=Flagellimonas onchidii TaxID=2562684 RepID=UPI0010A5A9DB|nr:patatin-like phospholipase family protein [Allomuricauda onchidii]